MTPLEHGAGGSVNIPVEIYGPSTGDMTGLGKEDHGRRMRGPPTGGHGTDIRMCAGAPDVPMGMGMRADHSNMSGP